MAIYKEIVDGKIFTTNRKNLITGATRIEVYTEKEYFELQQKKWWQLIIEKYFKNE